MSEGLVNYTDIMTYIIQNYEHIAISTLNRRLGELHEMGLVEKQPKENRPNDFTYHPTDELLQVAEALKSLLAVTDGEKHKITGNINKFRGEDFKLELTLPDELRAKFEDDQKIQVGYFEFSDNIVLLISKSKVSP